MGKAVEGFLQTVGIQTLAGIFNRDHQLSVAILVFGTHGTLLGVLPGVDTELLDDRAQVLLVDGHQQTVVWVFHHHLDIRRQITPPHIAPALEEHGEVGLLIIELNHMGIQT